MKTVYALNEINGVVITIDVQHQSMKNYVYVILNPQDKQAIVIDPAWEIDKIEAALNGFTLTHILLTHSHIDHTHLVIPLVEKHRCSVWMSKAEIESSGYQCPQLNAINTEAPLRCGTFLVQPFFTPGHTPGSVCFGIGEALFTGDTLFSEGCGACFGDEGNPRDLYASLRYLKQEIPESTRIFPGHSFGIPPGQTLKQIMGYNIYLSFTKESAFVAFRMRKGQAGFFDFK